MPRLRWRAPVTTGIVFCAALTSACKDSPVSAAAQRADAAPASAAQPINPELAPRRARFAKLVALSEWNSNAWAAIAEFYLIDATGASIDRSMWKVSADSADVNDPVSHAIDGNPKTHWHTRWQGVAAPMPHEFIVDMGAPVTVTGFRMLPRQDGTSNGTIGRYSFHLSTDGVRWGEPVAQGSFVGVGAPGDEMSIVFAAQHDNRSPDVIAPLSQSTQIGGTVALQVKASDPDGDALTYSAQGLPLGLTIGSKTGLISGTPINVGQLNVTVKARDDKGLVGVATFEWAVKPPIPLGSAPTAGSGEVRFVRLDGVSEVNGKPWISVAELQVVDSAGVLLPRAGWVAIADSADANDRPQNAIDANPASIWHSQWDGDAPRPPHSLIVDLRRYVKLSGFRYLARQDGLTNGTIARFRFYTSVDGVDWGRPVAEGDFSKMGGAAAEKSVKLR